MTKDTSKNHTIHVNQEEMNFLMDYARRYTSGEQIPSAELSRICQLVLRHPANPNFVSLEDELEKAQVEDGMDHAIILAFFTALRDGQTVIHFTTRNEQLGPGRLVSFDLNSRVIEIQLLGEMQTRDYRFAELNNFGPASYNSPQNVGQTLLGAFWEARTTRKYLERIVANSYARLSPEEIDSFEQIVSVSEGDIVDIVPLDLEEAEIKKRICSIVGDPFAQKDWGGETCDIFCNIRFRRRSVPAAFVLKGKAYARRPLRIADLGKNGDQLVRMFSLRAEVFIIQSNGPIDGTVYSQIQAQVAEKLMTNQPVYYLVMDGVQTARLLRAYDKI